MTDKPKQGPRKRLRRATGWTVSDAARSVVEAHREAHRVIRSDSAAAEDLLIEIGLAKGYLTEDPRAGGK